MVHIVLDVNDSARQLEAYYDGLKTLNTGMCTRPSEPRPRRDVAASETLAETLKLPRLSRASTSCRDVFCDIWENTLTIKKNKKFEQSHEMRESL